MTSRRKPRPPNASAVEYILSPRLEREPAPPTALTARRRAAAPRSPRTFKEFVEEEPTTLMSSRRLRLIKSFEEARQIRVDQTVFDETGAETERLGQSELYLYEFEPGSPEPSVILAPDHDTLLLQPRRSPASDSRKSHHLQVSTSNPSQGDGAPSTQLSRSIPPQLLRPTIELRRDSSDVGEGQRLLTASLGMESMQTPGGTACVPKRMPSPTLASPKPSPTSAKSIRDTTLLVGSREEPPQSTQTTDRVSSLREPGAVKVPPLRVPTPSVNSSAPAVAKRVVPAQLISTQVNAVPVASAQAAPSQTTSTEVAPSQVTPAQVAPAQANPAQASPPPAALSPGTSEVVDKDVENFTAIPASESAKKNENAVCKPSDEQEPCMSEIVAVATRKRHLGGWTVQSHPDICIQHRPYVPEASLSRTSRQMTSQRVQMAVKQWAEEQKRLSHIHRRIFAPASLPTEPPKPIKRVRVSACRRCKDPPENVCRIKPKFANLIGSVQPVTPRNIERLPTQCRMKRAETDEVISRSLIAEDDDADNNLSHFIKPAAGSMEVYLQSDLSSAHSSTEMDDTNAIVKPHLLSPLKPLYRDTSDVEGKVLKRPVAGVGATEETLPGTPEESTAKPAGVGGLSAIFAAIQGGGGSGGPRGRRAGKDAGAQDPTVDKIFGIAPPANKTPKKLNWLPLRPAQLSKTIWATILQDDFNTVDCESIHHCGGTINGKGICGGVNICHSGTHGDVATSARAILTVGRNSQPQICEKNFNITFMPIKIDPDYSTLDEYFFEEDIAKTETSSTVKTKRLGILDQRRIQNLQIALKGLGIYDDKLFIVQTVLEMNTIEVHELIELYRSEKAASSTLPAADLFGAIPDIKTPRPGVDASFTTEACGVLVKLVPTEEEIELLKQADVNDLTLAEQHLLEWSTVSRFAEKLECLSSISIYVETYGRIYAIAEQMLVSTQRALAELQTGHCFKGILALILKCGNYLNYKRRKFAQGVQYTSLDLLRRTMSFDESRSLLRHISGVIDHKWPAVWAVMEEAFDWQGSSGMMSLKELKGQVSLLEQRVRKICVECTGHGNEHSELFVSVLSIFLDVSAGQIAKLSATIEELHTDFIKLSSLFIADADDPEQGIEVLKFLIKFRRDMLVARDAQREFVIQERIKTLRKFRK